MSGHPPVPPDGSAPEPAVVIPTGTAVVGLHDEPLGHVAAVYADNATGHPAWAAVQGVRHTTVVPMELSRYDGTTLRVPFPSEQLRSAPVHDPSTLISYEQGDALARHYGLLPPAPADPITPDPVVPVPAAAEAFAPEPAATGHVSPDQVTPGQVAPGQVPPVQVTAEQVTAEPVTAHPVIVQPVAAVVAAGVGPRSADGPTAEDGARPVTHVVTEDRMFTVTVRRQEAVPLPDFPDQQAVPAAVPAEEVHVVHAEPVLITTRVVPIEQVEHGRHAVIVDEVGGRSFETGDPVDDGQDDPFPPVDPQDN